MSRVLLCSVVLLSAACSSSGPANSGGNAGTTASGGAGGSISGGGSSGTVTSAGAPASGGGVTGVAGNPGGAGAPANAGAGGAASSGAGAGGVSAGGAGVGGAAVGNESVTQRGADNAKTSHWLAPTLTKPNVMTKMALDANFKANFKGEFTGSPLFLAGATPGTGRFFAATTENDVYALDEMTGTVVTGWPHNIGGYLVNAPVCGGDPVNHGIVGTPILDAVGKKIYVAAAMTDGHHEVHALSTDTGMEVMGWPVNISKINTGAVGFQSDVQNQRSALTLVNGTLYVAYGGYCGDAGQYRGFVFGINTADPTKVGSWYTMDARQSGIWAAGGFPSDGNGIFAVTGNAAGVSGNHANSDSEEILRITDLGTAHRDTVNMFYPTAEWVDPMNTGDQDFGSASPAIVSVPGATPSSIIVAPAKPGRVYFLDAANLGGSLGQFADMTVADTQSSTVYTAPTAYQAASGVHIAIATGGGSQCPMGMTLDAAVMSILLKPSAAGQVPMPSKVWCTAIGGGDTSKRAPISTNSAGTADPIVWYLNGGNLNAFDGEDGTVLYDSSSTKGGATASSCAGIHKFTSLMAVNGRIVVGGDSGGSAHLCSWSVH